MSRFNKELYFAIKVVLNAIKIAEWFQKEGFKTYTKEDDTPVTLADMASQIFIVSKIKEKFPDDKIIAEEDDSFVDHIDEEIIKKCFQDNGFEYLLDYKKILTYKGTDSIRKWTVDPIDGTEGFREGLVYSVGISLIENNTQKLSVIGVPNYDERGTALYIAEEGKGAQSSYGGSQFNKIQVSEQIELEKARMCHSLHYNKPWVRDFTEMVGIKDLIQIDSMAKLCKVAEGSADLYIKPISRDHSFSWDFSPGYLLVKEAGGKMTDLNGNKLQFVDDRMICKTPGFLASNGKLHDQILNQLKNIKI